MSNLCHYFEFSIINNFAHKLLYKLITKLNVQRYLHFKTIIYVRKEKKVAVRIIKS